MDAPLAHGHGTWHLILESVAAVVLVAGGAIVLGLAWRRRLAPVPVVVPGRRPVDRPEERAHDAEGIVRLLLAALSLGAAVIHVAAVPAHLAEDGGLGIGFALAAVLQAGWAGLVLARHPATRRAGLAIHGAIALGWYVSRTSGLPLGAHPGIPEPIGMGDLVAAAFAGAIVLALVWRVGIAPVRLTRPLLPLAVPLLGLAFLLTVRAVGDVSGPGHHSSDLAGGAAAGAAADHRPGTPHDP